jgi:hypothetical protein
VDSPGSCRISVPGSTQVSSESRSIFAYGTVTLFGWLSHTILLTDRFVTFMCRTLQPRPCKQGRFGLIPVRSPLLGKWSIFLRVLRCFSSPGALLSFYGFKREILQVRCSGFPHSEISGSNACSRLTGAYRSVPRPSSALGAKASTVSS